MNKKDKEQLKKQVFDVIDKWLIKHRYANCQSYEEQNKELKTEMEKVFE